MPRRLLLSNSQLSNFEEDAVPIGNEVHRYVQARLAFPWTSFRNYFIGHFICHFIDYFIRHFIEQCGGQNLRDA